MDFIKSETVEFKESIAELADAMISICAMLNTHSRGTIYFGIEDDGTIIGQDISTITLIEIAQEIVDSIEPRIHPMIEVVDVGIKQCVKLEFFGKDKPYSAYGTYYFRQGTNNSLSLS
jgi:predicted HTH transcriptional regulator